MKNVSEKWLAQAPKEIEESKLECCNVVYNDLIASPIDTVKEVYRYFKWEFTPEYEKVLKEYIAANKKEREALKNKKGGDKLHTYEPAEFGLTEAELCEGSFKSYIEKYKTPMSRG